MESLLTKEVITTICIIISSLILYFILKQILNNIFIKNAQRHSNKKALTVFTILINIIKYIILAIALLTILATWGVDTNALITSLGVVGVVAGLALQDILKDFLVGASILTEDQFKVGDNIQIDDFRGTVIYVGMKTTKIKASTGEVKIISNRNITEVINYSLTPSTCYIDVELSSESKENKTEEVLKNVIERVSKKVNYLKKPIKILGIEELKPNTITYRIEAELSPLKDSEFKRIFLKEIKLEAEAHNLNLTTNKVDVHNV